MELVFGRTSKGKECVYHDGYEYQKLRTAKSGVVTWVCVSKYSKKCYTSIQSKDNILIRGPNNEHQCDVPCIEVLKLVLGAVKRPHEEDTSISQVYNNALCDLHGRGSNIAGYKLGKLIIEGKTKQVWEILDSHDEVLILSKDRITAGDGVKAHNLEGKAEISNQTNEKIFEILNTVGLQTAFIKSVTKTAFLAKKCEMVPIEWVTRRLATGSFLKRNPGVPEGYRFNPPKQETFFKDDANHDPQWSDEQIVAAGFRFNGRLITKDDIDVMKRMTVAVFEVLEKAWATRDCALIDMKIEFGVTQQGDIVLSDVIDSDSWRLWPSGDKRLMKDKQVYRNLVTVTQADLDTVKNNFKWIEEQLTHLTTPSKSLVVVLMGSPSDEEHCASIAKHCDNLGLECHLRCTSAHKGTQETLQILAEYEGSGQPVVFVAVAGRSNGLGPVLSGNTVFPVINCPPLTATNVSEDIWSSLKTPSGLGCTTVLYPEAAAIAAAQIHALHDHILWAKLRIKALNNFVSLKDADKILRVKK